MHQIKHCGKSKKIDITLLDMKDETINFKWTIYVNRKKMKDTERLFIKEKSISLSAIVQLYGCICLYDGVHVSGSVDVCFAHTYTHFHSHLC